MVMPCKKEGQPLDALQSLAREHRLIRQTLDAFEVYAGYVEADVPVDPMDLSRFIAFFEGFADLHHHDKEETLLFPALVTAGLDWNGELLARLRREHELERCLMRSLEHTALQCDAWTADDRRNFLSLARGVIAFQRDHMRFETTDVFSRAERVLSKGARERLSRDMHRFDEVAEPGNGLLCALAESLKRRYVRPSGRTGTDVDSHAAQERRSPWTHCNLSAESTG
jgi:hemerythrin-like domain-containing protein